jgi:hypothetical protein
MCSFCYSSIFYYLPIQICILNLLWIRYNQIHTNCVHNVWTTQQPLSLNYHLVHVGHYQWFQYSKWKYERFSYMIINKWQIQVLKVNVYHVLNEVILQQSPFPKKIFKQNIERFCSISNNIQSETYCLAQSPVFVHQQHTSALCSNILGHIEMIKTHYTGPWLNVYYSYYSTSTCLFWKLQSFKKYFVKERIYTFLTINFMLMYTSLLSHM